LVATGGNQRQMQRRRHDDDRAEVGVPATDAVRVPPSTVREGVNVERHDSHVEDEIGGRQRRNERVVWAAQLRTVDNDGQHEQVADNTDDNDERNDDAAYASHDVVWITDWERSE